MKSIKNLFMFTLITMLFMACGDAGSGPETITIGQAFGVCFGRASYVIPLIIATIISAGGIVLLLRKYQREQTWSGGNNMILFVLLVLFFFALMAVPSEMAANTTVEMYNRGVYI